MTIHQAVMHLIGSESFQQKAKQRNTEGSKYRMFLKRFLDGMLKNGAAVDMLQAHGYDVNVDPPANSKR